MDTVLQIIKYWAIVQLGIIIILIILFHLTRFYISYKVNRDRQRVSKINYLLKQLIQQKDSLTHTTIIFFRKYIFDFILCYENIDTENKTNANWHLIKKEIDSTVLMPQAHVLSFSRNWFNRYLATRCLELAGEEAQEKIILKLVEDEVILISINVAIFIFNHPRYATINKLIDVFSKTRRILQTTFVSILKEGGIKDNAYISEIIFARLAKENDPYIRILCYRILTVLTPLAEYYQIPETDLRSANTDLKIAALNYLCYVDYLGHKSMLLHYLKDSQDEVRAALTRELTGKHDASLIPIFEQMLSDTSWWVRINAALALKALGNEGREALEKQSVNKDIFAYETAQAILKIAKM